MSEQKLFDNAAFLKVEGDCVAGWHKCRLTEILGNQDETYEGQFDKELLKWVGAPLPKEEMAEVLALAKHYPHTEIHVCLYYNSKEKKWHFHVPNQKGTGAHVSYNDEAYTAPKGYYFSGTIHTHPNIEAFWSTIDQKDQQDKSGLHVVLSLKDGDLADYLVCLTYNGAEYPQDKSLVELPDLEHLPEPKEEWLDLVEETWHCTEKEAASKLPSKFEWPEALPYYKRPDYTHNWDYDWEDDYTPRYRSEAEVNEACENLIEHIVDGLKESVSDERIYQICQTLLESLGEEALADKVGEAASQFKEDSDSALF